ncbi:arginine--tRNA ligase cytoplasmic-like isoform X2 [Tripterygium wilfordii]|uniref:Arginine--tRNA ligase cytoplasmic-like isoform X2 n=1 Tax=Tripterygium wilfordii TaxID=458696 RepID=A0A7J7D9G8_TRIWF|nr:arginine--tRNA ligase cytoplasmic-like isoform X2 [Tripterygium wilfordii]
MKQLLAQLFEQVLRTTVSDEPDVEPLAAAYTAKFGDHQWYRLNEEKAEWIATERAGWLPDDDSTYQKTSHVGFGLVLVEDSKMLLEVVRLVDLLVAAMSRIKDALIEQGIDKEWTEEVLEHTAEAVGYGAVK